MRERERWLAHFENLCINFIQMKEYTENEVAVQITDIDLIEFGEEIEILNLSHNSKFPGSDGLCMEQL